MLPPPLLPSFAALYRCRLSAALSAIRSGASGHASGVITYACMTRAMLFCMVAS